MWHKLFISGQNKLHALSIATTPVLITHTIITMTTASQMNDDAPTPPKKRAIGKDEDDGDTTVSSTPSPIWRMASFTPLT